MTRGEEGSLETKGRVVVYTTEFCAFCERAKTLLEVRGIEYAEVFLSRSQEGRDRLAEIAPHGFTFPQVVIDGTVIGGYEELVAYDRGGGLITIKEGLE